MASIIIIFLFLISAAAAANNNTSSNNNSIDEASKDYGNIIRNLPSSVLQPSSVDDILKLILQINSSPYNKTTNAVVAARGHGHSLRGQAMALGGVVVNMTALKNEIIFGKGYADVAGGQLWINVLRATLDRGLAPVSWTDYIYLTVGGTLSNAGISGQAFNRGPQIANVLQLDVVTGKGQNITCSPYKNPELFHGVLGGLGQFGIITKARIVLEPAPTGVKWARLIYSDFSSFTHDQEYLINNYNNNGSISYVEGHLILNATIVTSQWAPLFTISPSQQSHIADMLKNQSILYSIELALYYNDQTAQTVQTRFEALIHNELKFTRGLNFSNENATFFDFINRVPNLDTPDMGSLLAHPWLNLFVPKSRIVDFNRLVLAGLLPEISQTTGLFIFYPLNKNKWDDNMSAVTPEKEDVFYTLGLLHTAETNGYKRFDVFNEKVLSVCENAGIEVKVYLAGYKTQDEWKKHFGMRRWNVFSKRKQMFDPKHILSPGQAIFN